MARKLAMITRSKLNLTTETLNYLAGVIDSDGYISISKMKIGRYRTINPRYVLTVTITNTSKKLMLWLVENFDGRFKARTKSSILHKTTYDWFYSNGKAITILEMIEPYLIVKKEQARVGIELIKNWITPIGGQGSKTNPDEVIRREGLYLTMKKLNQIGDAAATTESISSPDGMGMKRQSGLMGNHERETRSGIPASI